MPAAKERRPGWTTEATRASSDEKLTTDGSSMSADEHPVTLDVSYKGSAYQLALVVLLWLLGLQGMVLTTVAAVLLLDGGHRG
jgi:hypothetical protein